ncbi:NTTRR-F1 domain [Bacillus carboniphilus]|uniref:NTTRR-F1 domain n=1 Tax=Bacillus carboniphilus TaxID=86663 RepID=A0ABY9JWR9_9BACI|nr:NTTRR-F1 domain [Bacillus carboniphilus]WLR43244.1 NTTRR-F1 domain [Bacillus carboniphilus]
MALIQSLIINGRFQFGVLSPWTGDNVCIVESPCPTVEGKYSAVLKSGTEDATLEQLVNVIQDESYQLFISLAASQKGTSPMVFILLEYLDSTLTFIENGLELIIEEGQLPNGQEGSFKFITENTSSAPLNAAFARLKISKTGTANTTAVIVDNVLLNRTNISLASDLPCTYVGNTGERTVTIIPEQETIQLISGNPNAMVLANDFVYVGNGRSITYIDTTTQDSRDINVELNILYQFNRNIVVSNDQSKVYVCEGESDDPAGFVAVIDTATNSLEGQITVGIQPVALALTSLDDTLYVLNQSDSTVSVIDTMSNTVTVSFTATTTRTDGSFLQLTPNETKLIIGYELANSFDVYNVPENSFNQSVTLPSISPNISNGIMGSIDASIDGNCIYIGWGSDPSSPPDFFSGFASYCADGLSLIQNIILSQEPDSAPLPTTFVQVEEGTGNTSTIYVAETITDRVFQIQNEISTDCSTESLSLITNLSVSGFSSGFIGLSQGDNWIVTANERDNTATFIQLDTFTIFGTSPVGSNPQVLVVT